MIDQPRSFSSVDDKTWRRHCELQPLMRKQEQHAMLATPSWTSNAASGARVARASDVTATTDAASDATATTAAASGGTATATTRASDANAGTRARATEAKRDEAHLDRGDDARRTWCDVIRSRSRRGFTSWASR
jgi:hypothetical protein